MVRWQATAASSLVLFLTTGVSAAHAGNSSSSVKLFDLKPFQGSPSGLIARAQPKTNLRAPSGITNIRPDPNATRYPAGVMNRDGVVKAGNARRDFGSFGIPYTTTRVQEGVRGVEADDVNRLSTTYPYSAVGKLVNEEFYCSASVIRRGLVLTAAHCILTNDDGTEILDAPQTFFPGHYNGEGASEATMAPYGSWVSFRVSVPASQTTTIEEFDCVNFRENDVAILAVEKSEDGAFVGDVVGTLGYGWNNFSFVSSENTGDLSVAAVTTLGYPFLMDNGDIMQRSDGPTYAVTYTPESDLGCFEGDGDVRYLQQGTNFTGGSSGGPWVVNFSGQSAELGEGAEVGEAPDIAVVGVTSFGAPDPNEPKDNFSSQFGQNAEFPDEDYGGYGAGNIGALIQEVCDSEAPEGGTLASQGYCD